MAVDPEVGAIIGGCVAGAIVFIAIVAVVIYLVCGKRRRKKERDHKKFHQLTPHTSPTHSQPSTLGHGPPTGTDPRLPKVSSNGLWVGAPGIYAGTPSPAYFYGRPGGNKSHHLMQPAVMQRASSETRLPTSHPRGQVPTGPPVYATGGSQQRIYHSQQLLTPVYEVMDPRNGSVYDVYQIGSGGGSKTKLLQEGGKGHHHNRQQKGGGGGKRLERSQSDVIADAAKRPHRPKPSSAQDHHRLSQQVAASKNGSVTKEKAQVHEVRAKSSGGLENPVYTGEKIIAEEEKVQVAVVASATDSMKLLAKNKTDDQKTTVVHSSESSTLQPSETKPSSSTTTPEPSDQSSILRYNYGGDIYAVPDKDEAKRRSREENPILARMQDMVIERASGIQPPQVVDPVTDIAETAEPLLITPREGDVSMTGAPLIQNPIYQEVEEVRREAEAVKGVRTSGEYSARELSAAARSAALDELDGGAISDVAVGDSSDVQLNDVAAASAAAYVKEAGASGDSADISRHTHDEDTVVKGQLEARWSIDTDGATGKHISVTAEAFQFLDTYLSDEDGGDLQSPPKSPVLSERDLY